MKFLIISLLVGIMSFTSFAEEAEKVEKPQVATEYLKFTYQDGTSGNLVNFRVAIKLPQQGDPRPADIGTIEQVINRESIREKSAAMLRYYNTAFKEHLNHISYDPQEVYRLGNYYFLNKEYEKARDVFSKNIDTPENLFGAATTNRFLGDYKMAINYYAEVISLRPNLAEPYLGRGICYRNQGKYREALSDFLNYKKLKSSEEAYAALGNIYILRKEFSEAIFILNEGKLIYPNSKVISELLVQAHGK